MFKGKTTDEELALVKKLWADGLSDGQIAPRLAALRGKPVTRNVIIGIRNRNGWRRDVNPGAPRPRKGPAPGSVYKSRAALERPARRPQSPTAKLLAEVGPAPKPLPDEARPFGPLLGLQGLTARSCRWPIGDPKDPDFGFCGSTRLDGVPYCERHARRAIETPQQRAMRAGHARAGRGAEVSAAAVFTRQPEEQPA